MEKWREKTGKEKERGERESRGRRGKWRSGEVVNEEKRLVANGFAWRWAMVASRER